MSYARFNTYDEAQAYNDAVQTELCKHVGYKATSWAQVIAGSDGYFYIEPHHSVAPTDHSADDNTYILQSDEEGNLSFLLPEIVEPIDGI